MVAIIRPNSTDSHPFQSVFAPTEDATVKPKKTSAKISGGPKALIAHSAIGLVATIINSADASPPKAEHMTAAPTAFPAWPFNVIL